MYHFYKVVILSLIVTIYGCSGQSSSQQEGGEKLAAEQVLTLSKAQIKQAGITLGVLTKRKINHKIKVNGLLDVPPQNLISITSPYGGNLIETKLLQGLHVHKGDIIATMEHPDYIQLQQDYLENKGQLDFVKEEFERQKELMKEEVNSKKTFQKAKADYEIIRARVNGLKAKLELIHVNMNQLEQGHIQKSIYLYSPINGYVTKVNVSVGSFVSSNTVLFEIVDTEHLHAEVNVFEKDVSSIEVGQDVTFSLANETKIRYAKVYLIGREINKDRTIRVHCHLNEEDRNLLPGMYLTAFIEVKSAMVNTLPSDAVVEHDGKAYVFVADSGTTSQTNFKQVEVKVTGNESGFTSIEDNELLNGTSVVFKGAYQLLSALLKEDEE